MTVSGLIRAVTGRLLPASPAPRPAWSAPSAPPATESGPLPATDPAIAAAAALLGLQLCVRCGRPVTLGSQARYCSRRCRKAAEKARARARVLDGQPAPVLECETCHRPFTRRYAGGRIPRFCSARCRDLPYREAKNRRRRAATVQKRAQKEAR